MTTVAFCSVLKLKAASFFCKVTLKSNIFLSYMIASRNDDKSHLKFTLVCLGRESFGSRPIYRSRFTVVETVCNMLVVCTCFGYSGSRVTLGTEEQPV